MCFLCVQKDTAPAPTYAGMFTYIRKYACMILAHIFLTQG